METENLKGLEDSTDPRLERLRALRIRQLTTSGLKDWTETDRQELLDLQKSLNKPIEITQKHYDSLKRQYIAGVGNNPPLTAEERKLIQEINSVKK